jgi:transposase-like protein
MTINELVVQQKGGVDGDFRRRVVSAYELGFITVEQVVNDLKISRSLLRRWCRWFYLERLGKTSVVKNGDKMAKSKHTLELEKRIAELEKSLLAAQLGQESLEMMLAHVEKKYDLTKGDIKKKLGAISSKK